VDANSILVKKEKADMSFDAATCIGCGACVAVCKNASAMLFTSAKVAHLARLPQGEVEREERVLNMVAQMDAEGFGNCSNTRACEATCPKEIKIENIKLINTEYLRAKIREREKTAMAGGD
jgi:succinate dehydrogenase / fumarate reductase iron-sulfur subunit